MRRAPVTMITSVSPDFELPGVVLPDGGVEMTNAGSLPIIRLPNGSICYFANMFVFELYSRGYSLINNGGTVRAYLSLLSHIIQYAYNNQISFLHFTDNRFQHFMLTLKAVSADGSKLRSENQQIDIIFMSLDFLEFIGTHVGRENFVGKTGVIRAERILPNGNYNDAPYSSRSRWTIENLPRSSDPGHGVAIGFDALKALKEATCKSSSSFLSQRNFLIIEMMEASGSRRGETAPIMVADILDALNNFSSPNGLTLTTLKHGQLEYREVTVPRSTLEIAHEYIKNSRRIVIKKTIGKSNDHGFLFISARTGKPLCTNYITNIFSKLRKDSGITEKAHPHQLRHLFAQNRSNDYTLLLESGLNTATHSPNRRDNMRRRKLKQQLGHHGDQSPDHYIQQAEDELSNLSLSDKLVAREQALRKHSDQIRAMQKFSEQMTSRQFRDFSQRMLAAMLDDLGENHPPV
ncbi:tyrosine-type recombinase/integrase [Pseudomonas sp. 18173]|uniref:tyrosine-type recombinase/integrase n=1 Tax=Pseudomonas sp. 18173 TaxID=3390055 RepID=UPI003D1F70CA